METPVHGVPVRIMDPASGEQEGAIQRPTDGKGAENIREMGQALFYPFYQGLQAAEAAFECSDFLLRQIQAEQHVVPEKGIRQLLTFRQ